MKTDFDAIVCGGGLAGVLTATSIVTYNQSASVLVVDRNPASELGKKTSTGWICGDATSKNSLDYVAEHLDIRYGNPEIEHPVRGVLVYSPDHKKSLQFEDEGYLLNRKIFPQRQMRDATRRGVKFEFGIEAARLMNEDGEVTGVRGRYRRDNSVFEKTASVVIDATGSGSTLRRNFPFDSMIQKDIDPDDMESTGRYLYEFEIGTEDKTWFDPDFCLIHFDQDLAPGGYCWVFPKGERKVNVGLGYQKKVWEQRNARLGRRDSLVELIDEYVRRNPVIKNPILSKEDAGNQKGFWQVPVRRHNDCLVDNGYALVGDAAWMPRPLDAGGIGPLMRGGVILGEVVARAIRSKDFSQKSLWEYNVKYMREYGKQMAGFEVLRKFIQPLSHEDLNYGMKHLISQEDIDRLSRREPPKFDFWSDARKLPWALARFGLARKLKRFQKASEGLKEINMNYPSGPSGFNRWQIELKAELHEADEKLGLN